MRVETEELIHDPEFIKGENSIKMGVPSPVSREQMLQAQKEAFLEKHNVQAGSRVVSHDQMGSSQKTPGAQ